MQTLKDVFDNYNNAKDENGQLVLKATRYYDHLDQISLFQTLPQLFHQWILENNELNYNNTYTVKSSIGQGNRSEIPWICIFNDAVTRTAQQGYYIVLLFASDMSKCYLSLNQGVTNTSIDDISLFVDKAIDYLGIDRQEDNLIYGKIILHAKKDLGKKYEYAAIKSFKYLADQLPTEERFKKQFKILLNDYNQLFLASSNTLANLTPLSDFTYQREIHSMTTTDLQENLVVMGGIERPPLTFGNTTRYLRSIQVSKTALIRANYTCEFDPSHQTFLTRNQQMYMEGHHLIPMSQQDNFAFSLDISENIVCLCPTCHRALHHGQAGEIKLIIRKILKQRKHLLALREIDITEDKLLKIYTRYQLDHTID